MTDDQRRNIIDELKKREDEITYGNESRHWDCDELLLEALRLHGENEIVEQFYKTRSTGSEFWYS